MNININFNEKFYSFFQNLNYRFFFEDSREKHVLLHPDVKSYKDMDGTLNIDMTKLINMDQETIHAGWYMESIAIYRGKNVPYYEDMNKFLIKMYLEYPTQRVRLIDEFQNYINFTAFNDRLTNKEDISELILNMPVKYIQNNTVYNFESINHKNLYSKDEFNSLLADYYLKHINILNDALIFPEIRNYILDNLKDDTDNLNKILNDSTKMHDYINKPKVSYYNIFDNEIVIDSYDTLRNYQIDYFNPEKYTTLLVSLINKILPNTDTKTFLVKSDYGGNTLELNKVNAYIDKKSDTKTIFKLVTDITNLYLIHLKEMNITKIEIMNDIESEYLISMQDPFINSYLMNKQIKTSSNQTSKKNKI